MMILLNSLILRNYFKKCMGYLTLKDNDIWVNSIFDIKMNPYNL